MIVSQNTKQFNKSTKAYSYTKYDALGRISEVGEIATATVVATYANKHGVIGSDADYTTWLGTGTKSEITKTTYDLSANISTFPQQNLRTRVSYITLDDDQNTGNGYSHATYFTYDIHGNVSSLLQHTPALSSFTNQQYKRVDYVYDLVSGNVNQVKYQDGQADAFYHKYEYDADNRITNVFTSKDNVSWNQDAKYFYYKHGPLARTEIGDQKVQAMDYAYTIQGWIKAVNSNNLAEQNDIGKDGDITTSNTLNGKITRDAMAYSLGYFRDDATTTDDDYSSIGGDNSFIASVTQAAYLTTDAPNLYNGNISHMVSSIRDIDPGNGVTDGTALPQLTAYKYDQLNRISQMKAYRGLSSNDWQNATTDNSYQENFSYDPNGNILTLTRNGVTGNLNMDNLTYLYKTHADGRKSNQLKQVQDAIASTYSVDIDNQSADNYTFDEIGNLKSDAQEEILNIEWTVYGKIKKVIRTSASTKSDLEFKYDASGNRVAKIVKPDGSSVENGGSDNPTLWTTTYYVRDAQGNTMATYEDKPSDSDFYLQEQNIFGSSRLGVVNRNLNLTTPPAATPNIFTQTLGKRNYELSNHLGNVLSVVTDRRIPHNNSGTIDYYNADIVSANDYYSFGAQMPGRGFNSNSYRYGFNGKEKTDEMHNVSGTSYDYGFRIYDPRLGRFLSVDPLTRSYPWYTPYQFAGNKPIFAIDLDGLEEKIAIYKIALDGSVALVKVINNMSVSDETIETPNGEAKLLWNISKNRLADGNDIGTTQYKYFQETTDGSMVETELERNYAGNLVQRKGKENAIIPDYTDNFNLSLDRDKKGTTYIGSNNPEVVVNGKKIPDYRREPRDLVDAAALQHDKDYDKVKAAGPKGAFVSLRTVTADLRLIMAAQNVIDAAAKGQIDPYTNKPISEATVARAKNVLLSFSLLASQKVGRIVAGEKIETIPKTK